MAQILKGAPVVAAMNEANAARCAALKEKGIVPTLAVVRIPLPTMPSRSPQVCTTPWAA